MRTLRQLIAIVGLMALLLAACGGEEAPSATGDPGGPASPEEPATADPGDAVEQEPDEAGSEEEAKEEPTETDGDDAIDVDAPISSAELRQDLHDRLPEDILTAETITWVGDPQNQPFRMEDDAGNRTGAEYDFGQAISDVLGVRVEHVLVTGLPATLLGIESGRYDFALGPIKATFERQETFDFIGFVINEPALLLPADNPHAIESASDSCGTTVAVVAAGVLLDWAESLAAQCQEDGDETVEVLTFDDRTSTVLAVDSGRADAAAGTLTSMSYIESTQPDDYTVVPAEYDQPDLLGGIVSKEHSDLAEVMYEAWQELHDQGVYDEIMEKWGLASARMDTIELNPAFD